MTTLEDVNDTGGRSKSLRMRRDMRELPGALLHTTNEKNPGIKLCPTCGQPVPPQTGSGRPRIFCSTRCRRDMFGMRQELVEREEQLVDARYKLSTGYWPGTHYWRGTIRWLELAIQELQQRIPAVALTSGRRRAR